MKLSVRILAYKSPQRYAMRRTVVAAQQTLSTRVPGLELEISEVRTRTGIEEFTPVVIYPSLVVQDRLVCVGRYPRKDEVIAWLNQAMEA